MLATQRTTDAEQSHSTVRVGDVAVNHWPILPVAAARQSAPPQPIRFTNPHAIMATCGVGRSRSHEPVSGLAPPSSLFTSPESDYRRSKGEVTRNHESPRGKNAKRSYGAAGLTGLRLVSAPPPIRRLRGYLSSSPPTIAPHSVPTHSATADPQPPPTTSNRDLERGKL